MDKSSSTATKYQRQVAECKHKPKNLAICEPQTSRCDLPDHESYCGTRTESSCERNGSDDQLVGASSLDKNNTLKRTNDDLLSLDAVPSVPESTCSSEKPSDSLQGYEIVQQVQKEASQSQNKINFKIKKYTDLGLMPRKLTYGYKDAVILCSDNDLPEVTKFKKSLETKIVLLGRERPKIALLPEIEVIQGNQFRALEFAQDRFTFVFLFITSSFVTDAWVKYSSENCLMDSITNPEKRWSVVPVFTDKREGYEIPRSINILKGVVYRSSDDCDIKSIRRLFENQISVRKEKELVEKGKQSEWVFKFEEEQLKARARIEELKQQKASLGHSLSMPNNAPTLNSKGAPHYQHSKSFAGPNSTDQGTEVSTQSTCYRPAAEHTEPVSGKLEDLSLKQKSTFVCNPASSKDGQLPVESTTYFSSSVEYDSFAVVEEKDENANEIENSLPTSGAGVAGPSKIEENKVLQCVQEIHHHHHHEVKTYHVKADNVQIGRRNKLVMKVTGDGENQQYSEETDEEEEEDDRTEYEFEGREYKNHPLETEDEITSVKSLNDPDNSDS